MTGGKDFMNKARCKNGHCSCMSIAAWCALNSRGVTLKLHDFCHNPECNCQKQITFTPKHFLLGGMCFKKTMRKNFQWD